MVRQVKLAAPNQNCLIAVLELHDDVVKKHPETKEKTFCRTAFPNRPLESRDAFFVNLHSCLRVPRDSSVLKKRDV